MSNTIGSIQDINTANGDFLGVGFHYSGSSLTLQIDEEHDTLTAATADSTATLNLNQTYYLRIIRDDTAGSFGTLTVNAYTTAARTGRRPPRPHAQPAGQCHLPITFTP